jgi:hypothetical protein
MFFSLVCPEGRKIAVENAPALSHFRTSPIQNDAAALVETTAVPSAARNTRPKPSFASI